MLASFKTFLSELAGGAKRQDRFEETDYRVAAAALLIHAMGIDGLATPRESKMLHGVLKYRFKLDDAETDALIAEATEVEGEAVDLYRFTRLLNRSLDEEGRRRIVEMLWELIYADGGVNEFEDNLVWRAADLLGISARERIELRRQVAGESGETPGKSEQD